MLLRSCFYVDFQLLDHIGSGAYGRAMKARRRSDGHLVVVKEVLIGRMSQKERLEVSGKSSGLYFACQDKYRAMSGDDGLNVANRDLMHFEGI